jgi:DNA-binding LacI/PurR family transcriptional regulator/biotin operon repressor
MPGQIRLAGELGASHNAVEIALRQLEHEGLLVGQGPGRMRLIVSPDEKSARSLRVAILNYEPLELTEGYMVDLQHLLVEAGHAAFFAEKSLVELGMKVPAIRRLLEKTQAEAWVVLSGSREVLGWFAAQPVRTFSLFGRRRGLTIAAVGPDKPPMYAAATRALIEHGHRHIVLLCRHERRVPEPGRSEHAFLDELRTHGIAPGPYHLPDWDESIDGFHGLLKSLFRITPPTAIIIDEVPFFIAAQQFLAERGLRVPKDVSLVCTDASPNFAWCRPPITHIRWDSRPVVRRIVRWADNVARGKDDRRQSFTKAEFVPGGTIGPVRG